MNSVVYKISDLIKNTVFNVYKHNVFNRGKHPYQKKHQIYVDMIIRQSISVY